MKLQLVMLTTVISMITKRQVEAQMTCFKNRDLTGFNKTFTTSSTNVGVSFKACKIPPKTAIIFYSEVNYLGHESAIYSKTGKTYYPRLRSLFKSFYLLGQPSPDGVHLFKRRRFQAGFPQSYSKADDNVKDGSPLLSAVVIGSDDWTIETNCKNKPCLTCLKADKQGGASFIRDIKNNVLEEVISVTQGSCSGTKYNGKPSIPECPCNPHGTVDGPDKCDGTNGICQCLSNHTGDDCDSCNGGLTWREGKCVAGCGCFIPGVKNSSDPCPNGRTCQCKDHYEGPKCDQCVWYYAYKNYDGLCVDPKCQWRHGGWPSFFQYDGHCNCETRYVGDCRSCDKGYHKYGVKCLNKQEFDKVVELQDMRDNDPMNKAKLFKILDELADLEVLIRGRVRIQKGKVNAGQKTAKATATYFLTDQWNWCV